jgi:hypothetical protein
MVELGSSQMAELDRMVDDHLSRQHGRAVLEHNSISPCYHKHDVMAKEAHKISLAHMWRVVYSQPALASPYVHKPINPGDIPEDRIGPKMCACCEEEEFTEVDDYICLFCRYYEAKYA